MSFITSSTGTLVRDMWTGGSGKLLRDPEYQELARWQQCPAAYAHLPLFCSIQLDPTVKEISRKYVLKYEENVAEKPRRSEAVNIRVQGFVTSKALRRLGSWNGERSDVLGAVQKLTLSSNGNLEVWREQAQAMQNIVTFVQSNLGHQQGKPRVNKRNRDNDDQMHLRRRVFYKAVEYGEAANLDDEDIGGDISCLQPDWTIGDKLLIFKEMAGGELMSITDMELDIGSFVDVVLEPEIINTKRGEVYVRFSMERIIVLRGKPVKEIAVRRTRLRLDTEALLARDSGKKADEGEPMSETEARN